MADKKGDKKDDKKSTGKKLTEDAFIVVLMIIFGLLFLTQLTNFFSPTDNGTGISNSAFERFAGGPNGWFANFLHFLNSAISVYVTIATIFSIVVSLAIIYVLWATHQLKVEEKKKDKLVAVAPDAPSLQSQKWQQVLTHVNSENPAEWRLAILEADVLLDDMVQSRGFHGETLGERLKNISKADFKTIDIAWEAHKIRNAIAHEGSSFLLSQRESKRVIGLYEAVFKEFSYI